MSKSKIEWTEKTWNPVTGCTKISPGCQNCYAERMSKRLAGRAGYPEDNPFRVTLHRDKVNEPLLWKKPSRIFVCSMGDLFHDDVRSFFVANVFDTMAKAKQHTFLLLTKRPDNMRYYFQKNGPLIGDKPLENIWLGVTVENQEQADKRIPILLDTPAAVRFVSVEPMLGPVDLLNIQINIDTELDALNGTHGIMKPYRYVNNNLDWVICGCESGPGARPINIDWVRSLRDQCKSAGVSFFLKQMPINGKLVKMPELDGRAWAEYPIL